MVNKWKVVITVLILCVLIFIVLGYRFTPSSAAKSNAFVSNDYELIEQYKVGPDVIFLFKSDEKKEYRTVVAYKKNLFYQSNYSTVIPFSSDAIQTIGGISYHLNNEGATLLVVKSDDEEVSYIEIETELGVEKKQIKQGETIHFLLPYSVQLDNLNASAFNQVGQKLFYYGYINDNNIHLNDLKWYKVID